MKQKSLDLSVTRKSSNTVNFKTPIGNILLSFTNTTALKEGAEWQLNFDHKSKSLFLSAQDQNTLNHNKNLKPIEFVIDKTSPLSKKGLHEDQSLPNNLGKNVDVKTHLRSHKLQAISSQNSLNGFFATLTNSPLGKENSIKTHINSKSTQNLIEQILSLRLNSLTTGKTLKNAVAQSGLFPNSSKTALPDQLNQSSTDLKQLLLSLQKQIQKNINTDLIKPSFLAKSDTPNIPDQKTPIYGQKPVSQSQKSLQLPEFFNILNEQINQSLSRLKLLQLASITEFEIENTNFENRPKQINLELPIALTDNQTAIIAIRISSEDTMDQVDSHEQKKWSMDMAIDTEETGPLSANIQFKKNKVSITIWSEQNEFSKILKQHQELLKSNISNNGLEVSDIKILNIKRPNFNQYNQVTKGRYLDQNI